MGQRRINTIGLVSVLRRVVLVAIAALAAASCGSAVEGSAGRFRPSEPGTLKVATAFVPSPGFWEGTPAQPTGGFEWALANELAKRFKLERVEVLPVAFGDLTRGELGGADLAISQVTPTSERAEVLDFSTPYVAAPPGVLVRPGTKVRDVAGLQELRWVALSTSTLRQVITDRIRPDEAPQVVDSREEALAAIDAGRADAMLLDLPVAVAQARAAPERFKVAAQLDVPEGLAVAVRQGSSNLAAVDSAVRALLANGTVDKLSKEWLGAELGSGSKDIPLIRTSG